MIFIQDFLKKCLFRMFFIKICCKNLLFIEICLTDKYVVVISKKCVEYCLTDKFFLDLLKFECLTDKSHHIH